MAPLKHAESSVEKFGGDIEDYIALHNWLDSTKQYTGDWTHRALRHHAAGVEWAVEKFNCFIRNSEGRQVSVRAIAEQHITEDCGFIPTVEAWLRVLRGNPEDWMLRVAKTSKQPMMVVPTVDI